MNFGIWDLGFGRFLGGVVVEEGELEAGGLGLEIGDWRLDRSGVGGDGEFGLDGRFGSGAAGLAFVVGFEEGFFDRPVVGLLEDAAVFGLVGFVVLAVVCFGHDVILAKKTAKAVTTNQGRDFQSPLRLNGQG